MTAAQFLALSEGDRVVFRMPLLDRPGEPKPGVVTAAGPDGVTVSWAEGFDSVVAADAVRDGRSGLHVFTHRTDDDAK